MPKKQSVGVRMKPSKTELGKLLQECRLLRLNLSQQEVARRLGISQAYYSMFEVGNHYPPSKWLKNLASVLQCDLLKLESLMPKKTPIEPKTALGKLIRGQRDKLGLTVDDLANRLGMKRSQINRLEIHGLSISCRLVHKLEKVLEFQPLALEKFTKTKTVNGTFGHFGRRIREGRYALGLNQTQLGKRLGGVPKQVISQIELGRYSLSESDDTIRRLAKTLNLDAHKLFAIRPKRRLKQKVGEPTTLPGQIINFRLKEELTQEELAKRMNAHASSVCAVETGRYNPSFKLTRKFREAIN